MTLRAKELIVRRRMWENDFESLRDRLDFRYTPLSARIRFLPEQGEFSDSAGESILKKWAK